MTNFECYYRELVCCENITEVYEFAESKGMDVGGEDEPIIVFIKWLHKKRPVLSERERKYLGTVIEPFRHRVKSIKKERCCMDGSIQSIAILTTDEFDDTTNYTSLPPFKEGTMYNSMVLDEIYTPEELGL